MYTGASQLLRHLNTGFSAVRGISSRVSWTPEVEKLSSSSRRSVSTCVAHMSESKQSSQGSVDNDGFNMENLDSESKEKLLKLKELLVKNSYYEKYKEKIVKAQQSGPMEFLAMLEGLKSTKTKPVTADYVPKMTSHKKRSLNEVMKAELLMELEKDDIMFIWQEYHSKHGLVAACIPGSVYEKILARTAICDTFVLPLARKHGHDFHVVQFSNHAFYFTPLVSWQAYKENSPVSLTLTNFDELKADKDVVLMRGEFDKNIFNVKEAQSLAVQLHLYYAEPDFNRNLLMEKFVSAPSEFDHTELLTELARMQEEHKELFNSNLEKPSEAAT